MFWYLIREFLQQKCKPIGVSKVFSVQKKYLQALIHFSFHFEESN